VLSDLQGTRAHTSQSWHEVQKWCTEAALPNNDLESKGLKSNKENNAGGEMAAAVSGIFNHAMTAAQAITGTSATRLASPAAEAAGSSSNSTSSDSSSSTISANDFLTLLVTEMQNQDPTANTDPNEYINQLVNVNSLEQLININQTLSTSLGSPSTNPASAGTAQSAGATSAPTVTSPASNAAQASADTSKDHPLPAGHSVTSSAGMSSNLATFAAAAKRTHGNLSVPNTNPAAHSVAQALGGQSRAHSIAGGLTVAK
jgi:flagellar basal-body rod modification protein FlgD